MQKTWILCLSLVLLSGCAAVAIGAGAGAGYYVGKDERPVGQIADDAAITSAITLRYLGDQQVSAWDINVDTYAGTVTLYGNVPHRESENRAIQLARSVEGVRSVVSRLTVTQ
jgi:hyperosmotically inducible protein